MLEVELESAIELRLLRCAQDDNLASTAHRSPLTAHAVIIPSMTSPPAPPHTWLHHLEDEADAAFLYRELARAERDPGRADIYGKLASVEDRHVEMWRKLLADNGHTVGVPSPSRGAKLRAWLARRLGSGILLPMLLEEEGREVKGYLNLYRDQPDSAVGPTALRLAKESKEHAET
ncbi:MAG TPA: hypothetical protein VFS51_06915, partial [Gemmatimonadales bacterium]|nr:hypothetical protein [Gemmatimonadales bacterium]